MKTVLYVISLALIITLASAGSVLAIDYPGRQEQKYKDVPYIGMDQLYKDYIDGKVVIVDVRSKLEFDTIHTEGAVHIPIADRSFEDGLKRLVEREPNKKIAFY
jgi:predicted sulfurtransferase